MLKQVLSEQNNEIEKLFEGALLIYNVCLSEIVRQVSVQCIERGELINRVWKAYLGILERALRISSVKLLVQSQEFSNTKDEILNGHNSEKVNWNKERDKLLAENDKLQRTLKLKEEEIDRILRKENRLIRKIEILQKEYEVIKKETLYLKEDNRVLQAKLDNNDVEFIEKADGFIEVKAKRILRVKRKKAEEIDEILMRDPLLQKFCPHVKAPEPEPENLIEIIEKNKADEQEMFDRPDYRDQEIDAPIAILDDKNIQTEVIDLCGDSYGESYSKIIPETSHNFKLVDLLRKHKGSINEEDEYQSDEDMMEGMGPHGNQMSEEQKDFVLNFQDKIDQVNSLILKMRQNFTANTRQDTALADSLMKSITRAIQKGREKIEETNISQSIVSPEIAKGRNRL